MLIIFEQVRLSLLLFKHFNFEITFIHFHFIYISNRAQLLWLSPGNFTSGCLKVLYFVYDH